MILPVIIIWTFITSLFSTAGNNYYVSASGNDQATGTSPATAWKSLERISKQRLRKNDKVLLEGGSTFIGTIRLDEKDAGDALHPVLIGTYGNGKAMIEAGGQGGISIYNTGGVHIQNLIIRGDGVGKNNASGIDFYTDKSSLHLSGITVEQCEVSGFQLYGIVVQAAKSKKAGFNKVKIVNCKCYANGEAGIGSVATYPSISHNDFYVAFCKTNGNRGILTKTDNHSGNGIVLSGVDKVLVEYCEASENGADCRSAYGGPVGIWFWNCRNGIIQNCISHHNHSGSSLHDGGGFDLDGGCSNCTIQQCLSYNNEGAGYLVCEFGSPNRFTNNNIIENTSRNDGLNNSYGSITLSGAGMNYPVTTTLIKKNIIITENKNVVKGVPAALYFSGRDFKGIRFENNTFIISGAASVLHCDTLFTKEQVFFEANIFTIKKEGFPVSCQNCGPLPENFWSQLLQATTKIK